MYRLQETLPDVDIVIVTVEYVFDSIRQQLEEKNIYKIITLSELLDFAEGV